MRGDSGVAGEGTVFGVPKFHSWGKCTMSLTNINSDWMSNASSSLCTILCYMILYYAGPLSCILGCNFFVQTTLSNNDNSKTVQALTLILARNGCSSQRAASQPLGVFITSNSPWSIKAIPNTVVAVRCEGSHFLILYSCAHEVSFPGQIPRSLIWERHLVHKGNEPRARLARSLPVVVGKVCEHHTGKALNSAANL